MAAGARRIDVEYDHKATPRRFEVDVRLEGDLDDEQVARLEHVVESCPLRRAFEAGFELEERAEALRGERMFA